MQIIAFNLIVLQSHIKHVIATIKYPCPSSIISNQRLWRASRVDTESWVLDVFLDQTLKRHDWWTDQLPLSFSLLWLIFEMHAIYCFIGSSAATPRPDSDHSALSSTRGFMWNLESFSLLFPALHVLYHIKEDRYHHQSWKHLSTVTATSASLLFIALFTEIVKFYNWHK